MGTLQNNAYAHARFRSGPQFRDVDKETVISYHIRLWIALVCLILRPSCTVIPYNTVAVMYHNSGSTQLTVPVSLLVIVFQF